MNIRAIGLSVAGLFVAGGVIAGATSAQAAPIAPFVDQPRTVGDGGIERVAQTATHTVSGSERDRVTSAIQQQDDSVIVHAVRRGADGMFHALGAKDGEPVLAEVSNNYRRVILQERPGA